MTEHLEGMRFPKAALVIRGAGFRDGAQDVRDFRRAVLGDLVRPAESLLLTSALAEARVTTDPSGNSKLSKGSEGGRRQRARDDAAAAAILAVAAGYREWHAAPRPAACVAIRAGWLVRSVPSQHVKRSAEALLVSLGHVWSRQSIAAVLSCSRRSRAKDHGDEPVGHAHGHFGSRTRECADIRERLDVR